MQNDMRDRLVGLLGLPLQINVPNQIGNYDTIGERTLRRGDCEKLADHLIANGVIVPPCKVEQNDGLYGKYTVVKNSTGELVTDCFVLKPSKDETARKALLFYADNCKIPQLSADIKEWLQELKEMRGDNA